MAEIRPLAPADLPAVQSLLLANLAGWPHDEKFLSSTLLDHPWADDEMTSRVAIDERGEVIGFVGAQVKRMVVNDRPIRGVCCSHLVLDRDHRLGAAGALLLRHLLSGGQDLTWTESATDLVVRMWRAFGGHVDHARACDWMLVLRPVRWSGRALGAIARRQELNRHVFPVGSIPFQALGPRFARRAFPVLPEGILGEDATSAEIVECLPSVARTVRLRVAYDEAHLSALFEQIESNVGALVRRIVRRRGHPIGWYAYQPAAGGASRVLNISADPREAGIVLGELVAHARAQGVSVIAGRVEPHLHEALSYRLPSLGFARQPVLHAKDPELRAMLASKASLLTRLDSEWFVP